MLTASKVIDETEPTEDTDISLVKYAYNAIGRITDFDQTHFDKAERQIDYTYDQAGFLESTKYPDGSTTITRTNDWRGRIDTLSRSSTELVDYAYIGARVAQRSYDVPSVDYTATYDNLGRVTEMDYGASIVNFDYSYVSNENNIYRKTFDHRTSDPYNEYSYDDLDRLTGVTYHDSDTEAFSMDDLGNRDGNQTLRDDGTVSFVVDDDTNRYTSIGGNMISHDDAGNLTVDKDGYTYEYDYENRIVKIEDSSSNDIAEYAYDALGRRIKMVDSVASETTLYYYNPEWQVLAEYDGSNNQQRYFVYGNYIDEPLVMHRQSDSEDYYFGHDHLYSTVVLIDDSGTVVERYEYDAYGTVQVMDASYNTRTTSTYGNPYTFTGRRLDQLDNRNLELMYYRHRTYDTYMARLMQPDPSGYVDGLSLYEYVGGCPTIWSDARGLKKVDPHRERDPKGKKKAKKSDKCFCITSMSMHGYKVAPTYPKKPKSPGGPRSDGMWVGAHCNINIHGYWKKWPKSSSCGKDGRAEVHWWEKFSRKPTHNPGGVYDGKAINKWHDIQSRRIPHPFKTKYSYHDQPGAKASEGTVNFKYEVRILAAAKSHPDCQCGSWWGRGLWLDIQFSNTVLSAFHLDKLEFELRNPPFAPPEWPSDKKVDSAFKFSE